MIGYKAIEEFTLKECEAFLKREDISEDERRKVEKRKNWLLSHMPPPPPQPEPRPKTIMEEFPEFDFRPTSLLEGKSIKDKGYAKVPIIIGVFLIALFGVFMGFMSHYSKLSKQYESEKEELDYCKEYRSLERRQERADNLSTTFGSLGFIMLCLGVPSLVIGCVYRKKYTPVKVAADYISYNEKGWQFLPSRYLRKEPGQGTGCVIFVKNRKFGVLRYGVTVFHAKVVIPAEYDKLTWYTSEFLLAENDVKTMIVDITHNCCTDGYDKLLPSETKGIFEVEEGGRKFLIDYYGNELT